MSPARTASPYNAPESSYFAVGAGQSTIWIEPEHDLVMAARRVDETKVNALTGGVIDSLMTPTRNQEPLRLARESTV